MVAKSRKAKKTKARKAAKGAVATSVRLISFRSAKVIRVKPGHYVLVVSGTKPCINMTVHLSPLVYIVQPDYWGIEVFGVLPALCLTAVSPYQVHIPLDGITGKKGVEVIGANKKLKINVPSAGPVLNL
jgi:hypothetical protein